MQYNLTKFKKIAICGAHGVGKTTLAKKMSENFGLPYIPEFARELLNATDNFNWKATKNITSWWHFELAIIFSHLFTAQNRERFISDRSLWDVLAYIHLKSINYPEIGESFSLLQELINKYHPLYDAVLFYNPPEGYQSETGWFIHHCLKNQLRDIEGITIFNIYRGDVLLYNDKSVEV